MVKDLKVCVKNKIYMAGVNILLEDARKFLRSARILKKFEGFHKNRRICRSLEKLFNFQP